MSTFSNVLFNVLKEKNRKSLHESEDYIFAKDPFLRDFKVASQLEIGSLLTKSDNFRNNPIPLAKKFR